ncbi:unnamed protein product [Zymoseptoria tritici ST99CH_1E4]|uniref:Ubiquitin-like protease family profile domain-containing protein n=1 Tax=Zymoseptoria tritici ST99CH_1E4 TaxID=1276532 RepID=A0A2H1GKK8_ZYMTR|nr:unnamed protein product [Zymoseptoria tritici ST99CH_1E4]
MSSHRDNNRSGSNAGQHHPGGTTRLVPRQDTNVMFGTRRRELREYGAEPTSSIEQKEAGHRPGTPGEEIEAGHLLRLESAARRTAALALPRMKIPTDQAYHAVSRITALAGETTMSAALTGETILGRSLYGGHSDLAADRHAMTTDRLPLAETRWGQDLLVVKTDLAARTTTTPLAAERARRTADLAVGRRPAHVRTDPIEEMELPNDFRYNHTDRPKDTSKDNGRVGLARQLSLRSVVVVETADKELQATASKPQEPHSKAGDNAAVVKGKSADAAIVLSDLSSSPEEERESVVDPEEERELSGNTPAEEIQTSDPSRKLADVTNPSDMQQTSRSVKYVTADDAYHYCVAALIPDQPTGYDEAKKLVTGIAEQPVGDACFQEAVDRQVAEGILEVSGSGSNRILTQRMENNWSRARDAMEALIDSVMDYNSPTKADVVKGLISKNTAQPVDDECFLAAVDNLIAKGLIALSGTKFRRILTLSQVEPQGEPKDDEGNSEQESEAEVSRGNKGPSDDEDDPYIADDDDQLPAGGDEDENVYNFDYDDNAAGPPLAGAALEQQRKNKSNASAVEANARYWDSRDTIEQMVKDEDPFGPILLEISKIALTKSEGTSLSPMSVTLCRALDEYDTMVDFSDVLTVPPEGSGLDPWASDNLVAWLTTQYRLEAANNFYIAFGMNVHRFIPRHGADHTLTSEEEKHDIIDQNIANARAFSEDPAQSGDETKYWMYFAVHDMPPTTEVAILPYNTKGQHWVVLVLAFDHDRKICSPYLFDSIDGQGGRVHSFEVVSTELPKLLELISLRPGSGLDGFQLAELIQVTCVKQSNGSDCGFFASNWISLISQSGNISTEPTSEEVWPRTDRARRDFGVELRYNVLLKLYKAITGNTWDEAATHTAGSAARGFGARQSDTRKTSKSTRSIEDIRKRSDALNQTTDDPANIDASKDYTSESEDEQSDRCFKLGPLHYICDFMKEVGRPVTADEVYEGVQDRIGRIPVGWEPRELVQEWLANFEQVFSSVVDYSGRNKPISRYLLRSGPGRSMESEMTRFLFRGSAPLSGVSATKDVNIIIVSLRMSSGPSERATWVKLDERAEQMMRSYWRSIGQKGAYPEMIDNVNQLPAKLELKQTCWIRHNVKSRSSTRVPFEDRTDTAVAAMLDAADLFSADLRARGVGRLRLMILLNGWDGLTTDNTSWRVIDQRWPNLKIQIGVIVPVDYCVRELARDFECGFQMSALEREDVPPSRIANCRFLAVTGACNIVKIAFSLFWQEQTWGSYLARTLNIFRLRRNSTALTMMDDDAADDVRVNDSPRILRGRELTDAAIQEILAAQPKYTAPTLGRNAPRVKWTNEELQVVASGKLDKLTGKNKAIILSAATGCPMRSLHSLNWKWSELQQHPILGTRHSQYTTFLALSRFAARLRGIRFTNSTKYPTIKWLQTVDALDGRLARSRRAPRSDFLNDFYDDAVGTISTLDDQHSTPDGSISGTANKSPAAYLRLFFESREDKLYLWENHCTIQLQSAGGDGLSKYEASNEAATKTAVSITRHFPKMQARAAAHKHWEETRRELGYSRFLRRRKIGGWAAQSGPQPISEKNEDEGDTYFGIRIGCPQRQIPRLGD